MAIAPRMPEPFFPGGEAPLHRLRRTTEAPEKILPVEVGRIGRVREAHGQEEERLEQGQENRGGKAEGELLEIASDEAAHEADGNQHRKQRQGTPR